MALIITPYSSSSPLSFHPIRYFEDESFNSYLSYVLYWKRPEYARFITYPSALFFLDMLQSKEFKEAVAKCSVAEFLHTQQFLAWQK